MFCNKHWKNSLEFWSFGLNFKVSCKITLLREILYFLGGGLSLSKFFSSINVSDLEFTDRTSPTIYLGKTFNTKYGCLLPLWTSTVADSGSLRLSFVVPLRQAVIFKTVSTKIFTSWLENNYYYRSSGRFNLRSPNFFKKLYFVRFVGPTRFISANEKWGVS